MSLAAAPVRTLTTDEWYELFHDYEGGRCELVRGHAIMTPSEAFQNLTAAKQLERRLDEAIPPTLITLRQGSVAVTQGNPPTIRVPDLIVAASTLAPEAWLALPADVLLAAEIVSPSSVEADWVAKRSEYAAAGIPNYVIVDVRDDAAPRIWLLDQPITDAAGGTTYADPTGDGLTVTLHLPECDPITIAATDLV